MKRRILHLIFSLLISLIAFAQNQNIELTFTATYYDNHIPLDNVLIENLTQNCDTMLLAPDTVLLLDIATGIETQQKQFNSLQVQQNSPNPFNDETRMTVYVPQKQQIECIVFDEIGRKLQSFGKIMDAGRHTLLFRPGKEKCYFLTVISEQQSQTIKMIHTGHSNNSGCNLTWIKFEEMPMNLKSQHVLNGFTFYSGDSLRFTGYATNPDTIPGSFVLVDVPVVDETFQLSIIEGLPCPETPLVFYENRFYQTDLIFDQCWLKDNLNVGVMIDGNEDMEDNEIAEKYCYENEESNCDEYGGLYQWNELMQYSAQQGEQGLCPEGWHIPTQEEYTQLIDSLFNIGWVPANALKESGSYHWSQYSDGNNKSGFTGLPAGSRKADGTFAFINGETYFWTSTFWNQYYSHTLGLTSGPFHTQMWIDKNRGFSVRCLKD